MSTKHERAIEAAMEAWKKFYGMPEWKPRDLSGMGPAIAAYQRIMREPGPDDVRVRVCVAITDMVGWQAYGADDADDDRAKNHAYFEEDAQFHFIEANVPAWQLPAEVTVEGEVVG